jgi:hypothetical protein
MPKALREILDVLLFAHPSLGRCVRVAARVRQTKLHGHVVLLE